MKFSKSGSGLCGSCVSNKHKPWMFECFSACHPLVQVNCHQPRDEINHLLETRTISVELEFLSEVYLSSQRTIWLEELLTSAHKVHQAAEGPAVDPEIRLGVLSCLWGAPLPQAGGSKHLLAVRCCFNRYIKIDQFNQELARLGRVVNSI